MKAANNDRGMKCTVSATRGLPHSSHARTSHVAHMASSNCTVDVADVAACTAGVDRMSHNETRKAS